MLRDLGEEESVTGGEAKEEIYQYLEQNQDSYPYDIATELSLDLSLVHEALLELKKEGKAVEE